VTPRVLHLAAGNRWTGAAAPAFAEVEALRAAGVEAHYAYVGGYKLEEKLRDVPFAHPVIAKAQNPLSFTRTVRALHLLIEKHDINIVHAHLTWDHLLARWTQVRVARTFHSRRTLRTDPLTRMLLRGTDMVAVVNDTFRNAALLRGRDSHFTPPPLDERQFSYPGPDVRATYRLAPETPVVAYIGKVAPGRGFEAAIETFAHIARVLPAAKMLIIGHGPHRPTLEALASSLGVSNSVIWAGYHEADLAEHYRAANVLLFTAPGSDEGHRAILEAMACGLPVASYPIDGVEALLGHLARDLITERMHPEALAAVAVRSLSSPRSLSAEVNSRSQSFGFQASASRLLTAYNQILTFSR
jgi:glycosyltransferase involved in cell wall biosynthesis